MVIATESYALRAFEPFQVNLADLAGGNWMGEGTLRFRVTSGRIIPYASKVNRQSGDAATLEMVDVDF